MRTGAIFARGSCSVLAWMLAMGAVVALSAGQAYAQTTVIVPDAVVVTPGSLTIDEGAAKTIKVQLKTRAVVVPAGVTGGPETPTSAVTVTVTTVLDGTDDGANFELDNQSFPDTAGGFATGIAYTFSPASFGTTAGTIDATDGESTVSARTDGDAVDGRNVLTFTSDFTQGAWDADGNGTVDDGEGAIAAATKSVPVNEVDQDEMGVELSAKALTVLEGDATGKMYTVVLGSQPTHDVTVTLAVTSMVNAAITATSANTAMPSKLFFAGVTIANAAATAWNVPQTVTVKAATDSNTSDGSATITHALSSTDADYIIPATKGPSVEVTEIDSVRTVTLSQTSTTVDEGKTITITATLGSSDPEAPVTLSSPVTVTLTRGDKPASKDYSVAGSFKIEANATAGSTVLTANQDGDATNEKFKLTASASGPGILEVLNETISFEIIDNDEYTLEASRTEVNEGDKVTLTVTVKPAAEVAETKVEIDLYQARGATVKVADGQDADPDNNKIAIIDEGEPSATFTLTTGSDADSNDETVVVRAKAGGQVVGDPVSIMALDDEAAPEYTLSVAPDSIGEADGEASVMLTVMTNKAVTENTTLTLAVDATTSTAMDPADYSIMLADVMIAKDAKMGMATLTVTPVADAMDESNETIVLTAWMDDAQVGNATTLTIIDGDSPGSGITPKSDDEVAMVFTEAIEEAGGLMEGGNMVVVDMSMLFSMADPNAKVMYTASSSNEEVLGSSTTGAMLTLSPMMMGMSTVSVQAMPEGMNMASGAVTAFTCAGACVSVNLDVAGAITFMLKGPEDMNLVEGGDAAMVMVEASAAVAQDTMVKLMRDGASSAGMDDFSVMPEMATIMAGEMTAEFTVTATADEMSENDGNMAEMLTLFLVVNDMQMSDQAVSFYLWDASVPALPIIAQRLLAGVLGIGGYRRYRRR